VNQRDLQDYVARPAGKGHVHSLVVGMRSGDGQVSATAASGVSDPASGAGMAANSPYLAASIAKMYTATVILKLVESGKLSLQDRLIDLLPSEVSDRIHVYRGTDHSGEITVDHLVTQTSGLADYFEGKPKGTSSLFHQLVDDGDRAVSLSEVLAIVRSIGAAFPPGEGDRAHYSDTNYRLLGAIYEAVSGDPIDQGYKEIIFEPLGLTCTYPSSKVADRPDPPPAAVYLKDRLLELPEFLSCHLAEGGLVTTVSDNLTFMMAFFEGRLFDRSLIADERYRRMFFPMQYGYGTMRFKLPRIFSPISGTPELLGHSGSTGSFAFFNPSRDVYLAGTLNQIASPGRPFRLMMKVLAEL